MHLEAGPGAPPTGRFRTHVGDQRPLSLFTPHVEARAEGRVRVWSWVFSSPLKSASEAQDEHSAPGAVVLTMGGNY